MFYLWLLFNISCCFSFLKTIFVSTVWWTNIISFHASFYIFLLCFSSSWQRKSFEPLVQRRNGGLGNKKERKPSQEAEIKVSLFTVAEFRNAISISGGSGIFTAAVASTLHSASPLIRFNSAVMLSVPCRHRQSHKWWTNCASSTCGLRRHIKQPVAF